MNSQMTIIIKFNGHHNVMAVSITANETDFRKSDVKVIVMQNANRKLKTMMAFNMDLKGLVICYKSQSKIRHIHKLSTISIGSWSNHYKPIIVYSCK